MQFIKQKLLLAIVVTVALIGGSAFVVLQQSSTKNLPTFYYYQLKPNGNPYVESDYTVRLETPPMPCGGSSDVCWIKAEDNGNEEPEITAPLEAEIDEALTVNFEDSENVKLRN